MPIHTEIKTPYGFAILHEGGELEMEIFNKRLMIDEEEGIVTPERWAERHRPLCKVIPVVVRRATDTVLDNYHRRALLRIEKLEEALFKIACGQIGEKLFTRGDMIDIAEDSLPKPLAELCLQYGRRQKRKKRMVPQDPVPMRTYSNQDEEDEP